MEQLFCYQVCAVLEVLVLVISEWIDLKALTISSLRLENLVISDLPNYQDNLSRCQVKIYGQNLCYFAYEGYLENDYCLFSSQHYMMQKSLYDSRQAHKLNNLLIAASSVADLALSDEALEVCSNVLIMFFYNLKLLITIFYPFLRIFLFWSLIKYLYKEPYLVRYQLLFYLGFQSHRRTPSQSLSVQ